MACSPSQPATDPPTLDRTPAPTPAPTPEDDTPTLQNGDAIRVASFLSVPDGGDGASWSFPADQQSFEARVELEGRGEVRVSLVLADADGAPIAERDRRVALEGQRMVRFEDLELPREGRYRLTLEVEGPGVRQRSSVSVHRG